MKIAELTVDKGLGNARIWAQDGTGGIALLFEGTELEAMAVHKSLENILKVVEANPEGARSLLALLPKGLLA